MTNGIQHPSVPPPLQAREWSPWTALLVEPMKWFIPAVVFLAILAAFTGLIATPLLIVGTPVFAFLLAYSINRVLRIRNRQQSLAVLSYLESAARLNLPFDSYLLAAELAERGGLRAKLHHVRANLGRGFPLVNAVTTAVPEFPEEFAAELAVAERLGRLGPALTRIIRENQRKRPTVQDDLSPMYRFYPVILLLALFTILTFLLIFVMPKFREIFRDFRVNLPEPTLILLRIGAFMTEDTPLAVALISIVCLGVVLAIGLQLERIFTNTAPVKQVRDATDWITWHLPLVGSMQRDRGLAQASRVIADSLRAGLTLPRAIEMALVLPANRFFRRRLDRWRTHLLAGSTVEQAAQLAGLPPLYRGFLGPATNPKVAGERATLPDVFEFLGRYYQDRFSRMSIMLRAATEPAMVLCMGLLVGAFIYSIFMPLVTLINAQTNYYPVSPL
jgi:type II secretory pathway component PulF